MSFLDWSVLPGTPFEREMGVAKASAREDKGEAMWRRPAEQGKKDSAKRRGGRTGSVEGPVSLSGGLLLLGLPGRWADKNERGWVSLLSSLWLLPSSALQPD